MAISDFKVDDRLHIAIVFYFIYSSFNRRPFIKYLSVLFIVVHELKFKKITKPFFKLSNNN